MTNAEKARYTPAMTPQPTAEIPSSTVVIGWTVKCRRCLLS
jgi:hypothetical protein